MNKIFPVILIGILSGCGSTQIEDCADDKYKEFKSKPRLSYSACNKFLPGGRLTDKMLFDEINGRVKFSNEFYQCARIEHNKARIDFINQPLRKKLSNQLYETYYLRCKSIYE